MMPIRSAVLLAPDLSDPGSPALGAERTTFAWPPALLPLRGGPGTGLRLHAPVRLHHPAPSSAQGSIAQRLPKLVEQAYLQLLSCDPAGAAHTLASALCLLQQAGPHPYLLAGGAMLAPGRAREAVQVHSPARVAVYTLGRFEVLVDGKPLRTGRKHPKRTLALLKALIALGGRRVSRTALVDALWPDIDGDLGQNALEVTLHRLRCRLGVPGAIAARNGCLDLDPALVWVDALALGSCSASDPPHRPGVAPSADVETVFALYRGTFLPEDQDSSWSLRAREKLRARFVRVVTEAAAMLAASYRFEAAARLYERALAVDDLACAFHAGLAQCLERLGRSSEAHMALQRGTHLLQAAGHDTAGGV